MPLLFSFFLALVLQQAATPELGAVVGVVTKSGPTALPVSGANVKISRLQPPLFVAETTTGVDGAFTIPAVPAGRYVIEISRDGFGYRNDREGKYFSDFVMSPGQRVAVPRVSLDPAVSIHGHVVDADGKPMSFVGVEVLRATVAQGGQRQWSVITDHVLTDNDGAYRKTLFGAGDYYVRAVVESGAVPLTVYYPGTTDSSKAAPVVIPEGSDVAVDIPIAAALQEEGRKISGKVMVPPDSPGVPFIALELKKRDLSGPVDTSSNNSAATSTRANEGIGEFEFKDVRRGNYEIVATTGISGRTYIGKLLVDIRDGDVDDVRIDVKPLLDVKGRLVIQGEAGEPGEAVDVRFAPLTPQLAFQGVASDAQAAVVALSLENLSGSAAELGRPSPVADFDSSWKEFTFPDVRDGKYRIRARLFPGAKPSSPDLYIAGIRIAGKSVTDSGFEVGLDPVDAIEVVVGSKGGTIEGRVARTGPGVPVAVILLPAEAWRSIPSSIRTMLVSSDAPIRMTGLAPGKYKIFAVPGINESALYRIAPSLDGFEARALPVAVQKGMITGGVEVPLFPLGQ